MESKDFFFFSKRAGNREDDLNTRQRDYMSHSFTARLCFALCKIGLYILFKMNDEIWNPIFQICVTNRLIDKDRKGSIEKYVNIIVSIIAMHIIWIIYPSSVGATYFLQHNRFHRRWDDRPCRINRKQKSAGVSKESSIDLHSHKSRFMNHD